MSHKIGDVPSGRSEESNAVASQLFDPTVDRIKVRSSEVFHLGICGGAYLDAALMVLMKSVL